MLRWGNVIYSDKMLLVHNRHHYVDLQRRKRYFLVLIELIRAFILSVMISKITLAAGIISRISDTKDICFVLFGFDFWGDLQTKRSEKALKF